jgi:hypothetical protein
MAEALLRLADFTPLVGSEFQLEPQGATPLPARLLQAQAGRYAGDAARAPFSLVFEAPAQPVLPQSTYRLQHAVLGALEIFLVPVGRSATGVHYEAVFG